ncbi:hypothetical protein F8388_019557 [Cannabis sativa]|uniref:eRF1/Pelota-like N-terminal domain-containing protein n=1 Tax=Cannabis sativa TaxID=3483 RepID=A0A7J6FF58_CANSA|nr:hypothetical protein F8388_019557 [Cannabis sativa]
MKIVLKDFVRNGPGSVKMVAVDSDDLWYAYNLIAPGDSVMAVTVRKVLREAASGGRDAERVKLKLEVKVEEVADYDKVGSVLRIRGKNILENEHVKIGAFHTLELELNRPFVLRKALGWLLILTDFCYCLLDNWDSLALHVLQQASDPTASADLAVALNKFFENVLQAFLKNVDFNVVRCAVIASPGFTKDQFHRHLLLEAERKQLRTIIENKSRIILVHTTSGYKHSMKEVLEAPNVMNMIKDTKAAQEVRALEEFFSMLSNDSARACYGPKHVEVAHERMAVQTLLITDELFRNADLVARRRYVNLVESVKDSGGNVHIFSSLHVSGEQLAQISGIAAILRFPLPDLEDLEM